MSAITKLNIRARLVILCLAVATPLFVLGVFILWKEYRTLKSEAARATTFQAAISARVLSRWLTANKQELEALASQMAFKQGDLKICRAVMASAAQAEPDWRAVFLLDSSGNLFDGSNAVKTSIETDYLPLLATMRRSGKPAVSNYTAGHSSRQSAIVVGAPIVNGHEITGFVLACVKPQAVLDLFRGLGEDTGSVIAVVDSRNRVIARTLNNEQWAGKDYAKSRVVTAAAGKRKGILEAVGIADATPRAYAFERLPENGWLVIAGVPTAAIYGQAGDWLILTALLAASATGVSIVLAFNVSAHFTGPINELVREALAIGRGDLSKRARLASGDEFGLLAKAFNQMAVNLQFNEKRAKSLADQQILINHIVRAVRGSLNLDTIFNTVTAELGKALSADRCQIVQPTSQGPLVVTHEYHADNLASSVGLNIYAGKLDFSPAAQGEAQPSSVLGIDLSRIDRNDDGKSSTLKDVPLAVIEQAATDKCTAPFRAYLKTIESQSFIAAPLLYEERLLGVLIVHQCRQSRRWKEEDTELAATIADQLSMAASHAQLFARVHHQAITDGLTNLYNHVYLKSRLGKELRRCQRKQSALSLLMIDLDRLKDINDTFGHPAGDAAIAQVAWALNNLLRSGDTAARYGGEEFAVILPETKLTEAAVIADRLCRQVNSRPVPGIGQISVSIGAATYPEQAGNQKELIEMADMALYVAKHCGRNQVRVFDGHSPLRVITNPQNAPVDP